jgi:hypothetical protein
MAMLIKDNRSPRLYEPTSIKTCQTLSSVAQKGKKPVKTVARDD